MGELRSVRRTIGIAVAGALAAVVGAACSAADPAAMTEPLGEASEALAGPIPLPSTIPPTRRAPVIISPNANLCAASNYFATSQTGFATCAPGVSCDKPTQFEQLLSHNGCVLGQVGQHRAKIGSYPDAEGVLHDWDFASCPRFPATPNRLGVPIGSTTGFGPWAAPPLDPEGLVDAWKAIYPVDAYRREYCNSGNPSVWLDRMIVIWDPICHSCDK